MESLGRYRILEELGRGSMGIIYRGFDPEIGRAVAIKTIRWDQTLGHVKPEEAERRFKEEVKIVGQLQHPNIVTLYDAGESEGAKFFAMEYVEGEPLSAVIRREGRLPLERTLEILKAVSDGLAYAHSKGVVHRDIKPSNIMISTDGQVKITDFGIARWSEISRDLTQPMTGTPKYIPPEQVTGNSIDHRADIFSVGVLAYELLAGKPAFEGETVTQIIHKVVHETPPPPSLFNAEVSPALDAVIMKAMEKDRDNRYPNMNDFKEAFTTAAQTTSIERTVRGELILPKSGIGAHLTDLGRYFKGQTRIRLGGVALAALVALFFLVNRHTDLLGPGDEGPVIQAYVFGLTQARAGEIDEAKKAFEGLLQDDTNRDKGLVGLAYLSMRNGNHDEVVRLCDEALDKNPRNLYAHVLRAQVYFLKEDLQHALEELKKGLEGGGSNAKWEESEAHTLLGRIQDLQGSTDQALESYERAILLDPTNSIAYTNKGTLLARLGNYQGAVTYYQDLLKVSEDPAAELLASESRRQLAFQKDVKKREWIQSLIKDLDQGMKKGKTTGAREGETWSSTPLTVCICPLAEQGLASLDSSAGIFLHARTIKALTNSPKLSLVNREILDAILQELKLAQSDLVDQEKALKVGRIAGAQLIVTGTLFRLGGGLQAVLQVIETETTYVKAALSEEQGAGETLAAFSDRIGGVILDAIDSEYPLRGVISNVTGEEIVLDIGSGVGAKTGMRFKVLLDGQGSEKKKLAYVGILNLTKILEYESLGSVEKAYAELRKGQRVIELREEKGT